MAADIAPWVELVKSHPFKYRFRGFSGWHSDVREAAVQDERFMDKWMEDEYKSMVEELAYELALPAPTGDEDQPFVEYYASFLREKFWDHWNEPENIRHAPARKVIQVLEAVEKRTWGDLRDEWARQYCEPQWAWETIREQEPDYILQEHPPTHVLNAAIGDAIPVEDVYFLCPNCDHPVTAADVVDGDFKCYNCGTTATDLNPNGPLVDFLDALQDKLWPFKQVP